MGPSSSVARAAGGKPAQRKSKKAATCKNCQRPLASAAERNRGYCSDCPVPYDEAVLEALKGWRKGRAEADSVPAYVVFSDATLEALAEVRPTTESGLLQINGIGEKKVEKFGADLLELLTLQTAGETSGKTSA